MADLTATSRKPAWLLNRNFAWLWAGQSISLLGDWFFTMTLLLWIFRQLAKGQPWVGLAVGGITIATVLPALFVGPLAGVFIDRWDRRLTMIWMDLIRAVLIVLLLLVTLLVLLISGSWSVCMSSLSLPVSAPSFSIQLT